MSVSRFVRLARSATGRRGILLGAALAALALAAGPASQPARSAPTPLAVSVAGAQPVYLEQPGATADVAIVMTTANGQPLDRTRQWNPDGSPRRPAGMLSVLGRVARALDGAGFAHQEAVVAVARDVAQAAAVSAGGPSAASSASLADADNALLAGDPGRAVSLLGRAYGAA